MALTVGVATVMDSREVVVVVGSMVQPLAKHFIIRWAFDRESTSVLRKLGRKSRETKKAKLAFGMK